MNKKNESNYKDEVDFEEIAQQDSEEFYKGYSPLDEPVKERSYTTANIDSSNLEAELEEPTFNPPSFDDFEAESKEPSSFNPEINNLDSKSQLIASEQMVDTVLDVYGKAHILANRLVRIKEDKVAEYMMDGTIDPNLVVPIDNDGNTLGLMEYIQEYNGQLADAIKLEDDFIEKVRPAMIRVFQKKGLAMTDEQFLMFTFGADIVTKGAILFQLAKQNKRLIDMWTEQSVKVAPRPQPVPQPTQPTQPTQSFSDTESYSQPTQQARPMYVEPEEEFTAKSMVEDMIGTKEKSNFVENDIDPSMPKFGDPKILRELDRLARKEQTIDITPKKGRGRPKKK